MSIHPSLPIVSGTPYQAGTTAAVLVLYAV